MKNKIKMIKAAIRVRLVLCFVGPPLTLLATPATLNLLYNPYSFIKFSQNTKECTSSTEYSIGPYKLPCKVKDICLQKVFCRSLSELFQPYPFHSGLLTIPAR